MAPLIFYLKICKDNKVFVNAKRKKMFISLKDCLEEKVLLERKLAVALGLLATCKLDLEACRGEEEGQRGWLEMALVISAARLVIFFLNHPCHSFP